MAKLSSTEVFGTLKVNSTATILGSVTASSFIGDVTGNVTSADAINVVDESVDTACYLIYTTSATGTLQPKSGTNILFDSASGILYTSTVSVTGQLKSTVAIGTAPLTVTSTTLVSNLNADYLDSLHSTSFLRSDVDTTFTGPALTVNNSIVLTNPNNTAALMSLNWLSDNPRICIGGIGTGSAGTFKIQGISDTDRFTVDSTGGAKVFGILTVGNSTASHIYMTDTDNTTRVIHCNSNQIGFLTSTASWGSYCDNAGNWISVGYVQGTKFEATTTPDNNTPTANTSKFDGYGIIGNRTAIYVTNAGGDIRLGTGSVHGAATTALITSTGVTITGTQVVSSNSYLQGAQTEIGTSTTQGILKLWGATPGKYAQIHVSTGNLYIDSDSVGALYLNYIRGGAIYFGNGASGTNANVSSAGVFTGTGFVGPLTGTASVATTVTVADESADTTCYPLYVTAATGDLAPKSGSNLTFDSSTGRLTAVSLGVTNIVTNKIVKFGGVILDDSIMSDDGTTVSVSGTLQSKKYTGTESTGTTAKFEMVWNDTENSIDFNFI
jgi:hypothetical protein